MKVYRGEWRPVRDRELYNRGVNTRIAKLDFFFEDEAYSGCKMNKVDEVGKGNIHRDKILISMVQELLAAMGFKDNQEETFKFLKEMSKGGMINLEF